MRLLDQFLVQNFHVPEQPEHRTKSDYPALPLLLSLLDKAIDLDQPLGRAWPPDRLRQVKRSLQYTIFALLEYKLRKLNHNYYGDLLRALDPQRSSPPTVISLNYDIIVDNAIIEHAPLLHDGYHLPDYGCDIATDIYNARPHFGVLLKIHGSLNWSYCPGCGRRLANGSNVQDAERSIRGEPA